MPSGAEFVFTKGAVEVQENQKVHPMYPATLLMFLPLPLILGSLWGLIPFALYPAVIVFRIHSEEALLRAELAEYEEYTRKVRYRLIPFIW